MPKRETFSYGQTPFDLIEKRLKGITGKYSLNLNNPDALALVKALYLAEQVLRQSKSDEEENNDMERIASMRQGILETLDIEEI